MPISVCPMARVQAPIAQVWALLSDPAAYAMWWDARVEAIVPPGPARPGQVILARSTALGRAWPVTTTVEAIDPVAYRLDLTTRLPPGITVHNHIVCRALDQASCRVSFG